MNITMNTGSIYADFLSNKISNFQNILKVLPDYYNGVSSLDFMYDTYLFEKLL